MVVSTPPIAATPVGSYTPYAQAPAPAPGSPSQPQKASTTPRCCSSLEKRRFPASQSRLAVETLSSKRVGEGSRSFLSRGSGSGGGLCSRASVRSPSVSSYLTATNTSRSSDALVRSGGVGSRAEKQNRTEEPEERPPRCSRGSSPDRARRNTEQDESQKARKVRELNEMKQKVQMLCAGLKLLQRHLEDTTIVGSLSDSSFLAPLPAPGRLCAGLLDKVSPSSQWFDAGGSVQATSVAGSLSPPSPAVPGPSRYYHSHIAIPRTEDQDVEFVGPSERRSRSNEEGGHFGIEDSPRVGVVPPSPIPSITASPVPSVGSRQSPMVSAIVKVATPMTAERSFPTTPTMPPAPVLAATEWQQLPRGRLAEGVSPKASIPIAIPTPCSPSGAGRSHRASLPSRSPASSSSGMSRRATLPAAMSTSRSDVQGSQRRALESPRPRSMSRRSEGWSVAVPCQAELSIPLSELAPLVCSAYRERRAGLVSVQARGLKLLERCDESSIIVQGSVLWIGPNNGVMDAGEELVQCTLMQHLGTPSTFGKSAWFVSRLASLGEPGELESKLVAAETGRLIAAEALSGVLWNRLRPVGNCQP